MTEDLNSRIFDLILGRVFKNAYLNLDDNCKVNMEKIFLSEDEGQKRKFIKKYIPNFKKTFETEAKNIEKEIKKEIEKQL